MISWLTHKLHVLYEISGIGNFKIYSIFIFVLLSLTALSIEYFFIENKKESSFARLRNIDKSMFNDLICWLVDGFGLFNFGSIILTMGVFYYISGLIFHSSYHYNLSSVISNPYILFGLVFILSDLVNYVKHRFLHGLPFLWRLHEFHHSGTSLIVISANRGHFVEGAVATLFEATIYILIGASPINIIYISYLKSIHAQLLHSNLTSNWGFIGKYILVSPAAHRIHHSDNEKHFNKNLGGVFIFWDILFNTYYAPKNEPIKIGIPDSFYNRKGYIHDVFKSYYLSLKETIRFVKKTLRLIR